MSYRTHILEFWNFFHEEEDGVEAIQAVLILAAASVAMIALKLKWPEIKNFYESNLEKATRIS